MQTPSSSDLLLFVVYLLQVLWVVFIFIPRVGDSVSEQCFSNYHCARQVRKAYYGYTIDLADGQWREFRASLGLLVTVAAGSSLLIFVAKRFLSKVMRMEASAVVWWVSSLRIVVGVIILCVQHGYHALIVLSLAGLGFLLAKLTFRCHYKYHFTVTWLYAIAVLAFKESYRMQHLPGFQFLIPLFDRRYGGMYGWQLPTNFLVLRMISYSLDMHWKYWSHVTAKKNDNNTNNEADSAVGMASGGLTLPDYSLVHYLAYMLYAPLYMAGPIITYDNFILCSKIIKSDSMVYTTVIHNNPTGIASTATKAFTTVDSASTHLPPHQPKPVDPTPPTSTTTATTTTTTTGENIPLYALRFAFSLALLEYLLHRFPFFAIINSGLINALSPIQIAIVCYVLLKMMWLKFLLLWRFFRLWGMCEGIYAPENMTRCMSNTYSLELFWRGWHSSFNMWLVKYLYKPLGGRESQLYSVWVIFLFVALWHDIEYKLIMWGLLNALFYMVEVCVKKIAAICGANRLPAPIYQLLSAVGGAMFIIILIGVNLVGYAVGVGGVGYIVTKLYTQEGLCMLGGCFYVLVVAVLLMQLLKRNGYSK